MSLLFNAKRLIRMLRKERFFIIATLTMAVILLCSVVVFYFEYDEPESSIRSLWDGIWWAVVTICTVGYGDKLPSSDAGKVVALGLMISGVFLLSLVTATIASVFVEQKIREGKGLETIREKDHIVICGWNQYTEEVLLWLHNNGSQKHPQIILISELPIDEVDNLKLKYSEYNLTFLRGNFVNEEVLLRADIRRASIVVIMADSSGKREKEDSDQRTILTSLTVKSLAPKVKIIAELVNGENKPHLERASVDEIIVRGEYVGSLIASAVSYPGLSRVYSSIFSMEDRSTLVRADIPAKFIGMTFRELSNFFRESRNAILIGILKERESIKLESMLSDDTSVIDTFIREKIRESKRELFYKKEHTKVIINPDDEDTINKNDYAVIICREQG